MDKNSIDEQLHEKYQVLFEENEMLTQKILHAELQADEYRRIISSLEGKILKMKETAQMAKEKIESMETERPHISAKQMALRWECSRSSSVRIAESAGLSRVFLGRGRNGLVRYLRKEVIDYEASCRMTPKT